MGERTKSLCPVCLGVVDAEIYEKGNEIWMKKRCETHGEFDDLCWSDADLYKKFSQWQYCGRAGRAGIQITDSDKGCPFDCGLCPKHKSSTLLAIIDLTNRCNQRCPICFANAAVSGYLYEPYLEQIREMMELLRSEIPPCPAIQFSGGEPTLRKDFSIIVQMAKDIGFPHIQVATNGKRLAQSLDFCEEIREAGLHTVYLQFDGVTDEPYKILRGYSALNTKLKAIENCRQGGIKSVVLVPTLMKGVNDDQIGDMVRFAAKNLDIIRGLDVQPIAFEGRVNESERKKGRITIPDFINLLEEQTGGEIPKESFYPVPFVLPVSYFIETWKNKPQLEFTVHPHCGAATYVFVEDGRFIPITEFMDVEGFMELLMESADKIKKSKIGKIKATINLTKLPGLIDREKAPKDFDFLTLLKRILTKGTREAVAEFQRKAIFIGVMHFMDPYNFDLERVRRCGIHYATPDGRIIPFCTYNALHRPAVEQKFKK